MSGDSVKADSIKCGLTDFSTCYGLHDAALGLTASLEEKREDQVNHQQNTALKEFQKEYGALWSLGALLVNGPVKVSGTEKLQEKTAERKKGSKNGHMA